MDYIQGSADKCVVTVLDWEKAVYEVSQKRLIIALARFGVPQKLCSIIATIYESPDLQVADRFSISETKR